MSSPHRISLALAIAAGASGAGLALGRSTAATSNTPTEMVSARRGLTGRELAPDISRGAPLAGERSRRVLALHDSSEVAAGESLAHRLAALPLHHLGLAVDYLDVHTSPLPDAAALERYRGIITWFGDERMREPEAYLTWLATQAARRPVVVMEHLGALTDPSGRAAAAPLVDRAFVALGADHLGEASEDSSVISVAQSDGLMGFERPLPARFEHYVRLRARRGTRVHLRLERTDLGDGGSDVVFSGPGGGFVLQGAAVAEDRLGERHVTRWLVDPFRYFEEAFGVAGWPRPDITTRNGQRIFYSQIDGDGLDSLSELDYRSRCGAVIRDQIIRRYDLPFTASVVVGLTAPPPLGRGTDTDVEVARSIFALDNVEVASHGLAHPLDWRKPSELSVPNLPGYVFDAAHEIEASVDYIDRHLAPAGKSCRVMLWTGDCNPTEAHIAVADRLGLRNLNGGDPRMDAHYPSYAHLVAPAHPVGDRVQYYTSAANDYILTDDWTPPYYRYQNVLQTFERSGAPRRVVPVDVYFHFYSARNATALEALRRVLDWASTQPLAPVFASEYVDIVRDAETARIARTGTQRWTVRKGPALRTMRFDDPSLHIDVAASRGVLGYLQEPALGATYVHLDASSEVTIVVARRAPSTPLLRRASHVVDELRIAGDSVTFTTRGPGRRSFVFAGLRPGTRYRSGDREWMVDSAGELAVQTAGSAATSHVLLRAVGS